MQSRDRRSIIRRISDSDSMKTIIALILVILFLHLANFALDLVNRIEARLSASSSAVRVK